MIARLLGKRFVVWPKGGGEVWTRESQPIAALLQARDVATLREHPYRVGIDLPLLGVRCLIVVEPGAKPMWHLELPEAPRIEPGTWTVKGSG